MLSYIDAGAAEVAAKRGKLVGESSDVAGIRPCLASVPQCAALRCDIGPRLNGSNVA